MISVDGRGILSYQEFQSVCGSVDEREDAFEENSVPDVHDGVIVQPHCIGRNRTMRFVLFDEDTR